MPQTAKKQNHRPLLAALVTLVVLLAATAAIWLAVVRPQLGKGRTETLCDDFNQSELLHPGDSAAQVFTYDKDLYTIGWSFTCPARTRRARWRSSSPMPTPAKNWPAPPALCRISSPTSTRPLGWTPPLRASRAAAIS